MKNLRIVLLAVTAVLAVFTFSTMLAVRPGQQSAVLEAARARQQEPILSVTEPLETNTDQIAEEERIAELVAGILSSDEDFIAGVSSQVGETVPGYVTEWVQSDEFDAIMKEALEESISETVDRVISELVTDENLEYVAGIVAERLGTSEEDVYVTAFSRIASRVLSMITLPDGALDIESAIRTLYLANRDEIVADIVSSALAQYDALSTEEKIALLSTDEQAAGIYAEEREYIISDIVSAIIAEYEDLSVEEKIALLSTDEQAVQLYAAEREYIISDLVSAVLASYQAMDTDGKIDVLDAESIAVALYDRFAEALADELGSDVDVTDDVIALYEENKEYIVEEFLDIILAKYGNLPEEAEAVPEPYAETEPAEDEGGQLVSVPVFGDAVISEDAGADEYMEARSAARDAEIAKLLSFINR